MSYARQAIEEKLEQAARAVIGTVDVGAIVDYAHDVVVALKAVIDELDAYDNEYDRKALIAKAWKEIDRALLRAHPITMVAPADEAKRCTLRDSDRWGAGCHFRGKWTFDGLRTPGCKPHVTKRRDSGLATVKAAAWNEVDPPAQNEQGRDTRFMQGRPPTIEIVMAVADKLGVRADVEERIART